MSRMLIALLTLLASFAGAALALAQAPPPPAAPGPAAAVAPPAAPGQPAGAPAAKPGEAAKAPEPPPVPRQMHRWVDKDGVLNFSDTPPQPQAVAPPPAAPARGAREKK